jgi:hypothetical protein
MDGQWVFRAFAWKFELIDNQLPQPIRKATKTVSTHHTRPADGGLPDRTFHQGSPGELAKSLILLTPASTPVSRHFVRSW